MTPKSDQPYRCPWDHQAWLEAKMKAAAQDGKPISWTQHCDEYKRKLAENPDLKDDHCGDLKHQYCGDGSHNHPDAKTHPSPNTCPAEKVAAQPAASAEPAASAQPAEKVQPAKTGKLSKAAKKKAAKAAKKKAAQGAQATQPAPAGRFASGIRVNGSIIKPNDTEPTDQALLALYKQFTTMTFCPDRHVGQTAPCMCCAESLVYDQKPVPGKAIDELKAPEYYTEDHRPTLDSEPYLTHHCGVQDCQICIKFYLNCREPSDVTVIAKSGPVLKYLPAFYALLYPSKDHSFPDLEDICGTAGHALSLLMKHETRVLLPNTLSDIESHFKLSLAASGPSGTDAIVAAVGNDIKKRAEIVACLTLSLYGDLIRACKTTPEDYDTAYAKYGKALEGDNNPWGNDLFFMDSTPGAKFRMPFWGPLPNSCRCGNIQCRISEHDVEVYHRTLSLVRWALKQMVDPAVYCHFRNGIGNARQYEYEEKSIFKSVKRALAQQAVDSDRGALRRKLELIRLKHLLEGPPKIFQDIQTGRRLQNLFANARTAGMMIPALLVNSTATEVEVPFPKDGNLKEKEAWVKTLEEMVWKAIACGGMTPATHPAIVPEIRWFARYRAKFDHGYSAIQTAQDILDNKIGGTRQLTPQQKLVITANSAKVEIAIKSLTEENVDLKLDFEKNAGPDNQGAFPAWIGGKGEAVMDILLLAGAAEADRDFLLDLVCQWACYYWVARRAEALMGSKGVGPEPNIDDAESWCTNLTMMSGCRAELGIYFFDKILVEMLDEMLEAICEACHPGVSWIRGGVERPGAAVRAYREKLRKMQQR
ncbi:hypothetical protein F5X68DRAFT_238994 [Plectosphaerella plurivora]|uniref:Uncharacterized protein n=1 Tax=Plectosphaerella plurivora TaxID=936078 RepID=A0A9P8VQ19_9PEZI|nr:hypothetical protein F5X68DRAFT_238994 [Plectosphaerella plurivora]